MINFLLRIAVKCLLWLRYRIRVTPGKVEVVTEGSETLFYRTPAMRAFPC